MDKKKLKTNHTDIITSALSAAAGCVPIVGGFMSEIVQNVIPQQRQDRIVDFISELSDKLQQLDISVEELKEKFKNSKYGTFTWDCLRDFTNDVYEEKIEFYRNLCINAITNDEKNLIRCERILKILSNLDYYEIQYLRFYENPSIDMTDVKQDVIDKLGFDILKPIYTMGMNEEQRDSETYKQLTLNNLCNIGLLEREVRTIGNFKNAHISYKITLLGRLVLKKIGIVSEEI